MPIILDKNENPFEMSSGVKKAAMEEISRLFFNRYPDPDYGILREKLGAHGSMIVTVRGIGYRLEAP